MDSGTYVIAGGSSGIGLELVRMLAPRAARIAKPITLWALAQAK
jgi:NAD(P)-dependent dehydrogenase (short-subunit alcohol dehydrogenase family)